MTCFKVPMTRNFIPKVYGCIVKITYRLTNHVAEQKLKKSTNGALANQHWAKKVNTAVNGFLQK